MRQRNSTQLEAIKEIFQKSERPLSPVEILAAAQRSVPSLSIATVYRNLKALVDDGYAVICDVPGSAALYELAGLGHHHHFHCRDCNRVFDVPGCPGNINKLLPRGFTLEAHEIFLKGLCRDCGN